jgi:hypothetical protein
MDPSPLGRGLPLLDRLGREARRLLPQPPEADLDERRGSLLVRRGKGGRRREVGMDTGGWEQLRPWLIAGAESPVGPLFCIIDGQTRGRAWSSAAVCRAAPPCQPRRRASPVRAAPAPPPPRARARSRPVPTIRAVWGAASSQTQCANFAADTPACRPKVIAQQLGDTRRLHRRPLFEQPPDHRLQRIEQGAEEAAPRNPSWRTARGVDMVRSASRCAKTAGARHRPRRAMPGSALRSPPRL